MAKEKALHPEQDDYLSFTSTANLLFGFSVGWLLLGLDVLCLRTVRRVHQRFIQKCGVPQTEKLPQAIMHCKNQMKVLPTISHKNLDSIFVHTDVHKYQFGAFLDELFPFGRCAVPK